MSRRVYYMLAAAAVLLMAVLAFRFATDVQRGDLPAPSSAAPSETR